MGKTYLQSVWKLKTKEASLKCCKGWGERGLKREELQKLTWNLKAERLTKARSNSECAGCRYYVL